MMFDLDKSVQILAQTPAVLSAMLANLDDDWVKNNEGGESWSPFDVLGHLIHGERTDWIARAQIILDDHRTDKRFAPFDRFAMFSESRGKSLPELLDTFAALRRQNLEQLQQMNITTDTLSKTGIHPAFGEVTLEQLLATWVVHDLGHIAQISRVMAKQYADAVGPWQAYLPTLHDRWQ